MFFRNRQKAEAEVAEFCRAPGVFGGPLGASDLSAIVEPNDFRRATFRSIRELRKSDADGYSELQGWSEHLRRSLTHLLWKANPVENFPVVKARELYATAMQTLETLVEAAEFLSTQQRRILARTAQEQRYFITTRSDQTVRRQLPNLATEILDQVGYVLRSHCGYPQAPQPEISQRQAEEALGSVRCFFDRGHGIRACIRALEVGEKSQSSAERLESLYRELRQTVRAEGWWMPDTVAPNEVLDALRLSLPRTATRYYFGKLASWIDVLNEATEAFVTARDAPSLGALLGLYRSFLHALVNTPASMTNIFLPQRTVITSLAENAVQFGVDVSGTHGLLDRHACEGMQLWFRLLSATLEWERWNSPGASISSNKVLGRLPAEKPAAIPQRWESNHILGAVTPISLDSIAYRTSLLRRQVKVAEGRNRRFMDVDGEIIFKQYGRSLSFGADPSERVRAEILDLQSKVTVSLDEGSARTGVSDPYSASELYTRIWKQHARVMCAYRDGQLIAAVSACLLAEAIPSLGETLAAVLEQRGIIQPKERASRDQELPHPAQVTKPKQADSGLVLVDIFYQLPHSQLLKRSHGETPHALLHEQLLGLLQSEYPFYGQVTCVGICRKRLATDPPESTAHENPAYRAFLAKGWQELKDYEYHSPDGLVHRVLYYTYAPNKAYVSVS